MADEQKSKLRLEIAHVLFIDIVGYSRLRTNEQSAQIETLREIVRGTEQFRAAEAGGNSSGYQPATVVRLLSATIRKHPCSAPWKSPWL